MGRGRLGGGFGMMIQAWLNLEASLKLKEELIHGCGRRRSSSYKEQSVKRVIDEYECVRNWKLL